MTVTVPPRPPVCVSCDRERTPADNDYTPLQVVLCLPLGWYSGDDGQLCPECMTALLAHQPATVDPMHDDDPIGPPVA